MDILRATVDERDDAVLVVGTDDGVEFIVPEPGAGLCTQGPFRDVPLTAHHASRIRFSVTLSSFLSGLAQTQVKVATVGLVVPDVSIEGLVGDIEYSVSFEPP